MTPTTLQDRVIAYKCFELPGQPMYTHTGTSRLISDLFIAVEALTKERDEYKERMQRLMTTVTELKKERNAPAAAAKLALDALEMAQNNLASSRAMLGRYTTKWDTYGTAIDTLRQAGVQ